MFINNYLKLDDGTNKDSFRSEVYILIKNSITDNFSTMITFENSNC